MRRLFRITTFVIGLFAAVVAVSGSANATTWHNTGGGSFTATGTAWTLTANGVSLTCTGQSWVGTAPASSAGPTYAITGNITFTGCRLAGATMSWTCDYTFTGTSWRAPATTSGALMLRCTLGGVNCTLSGTIVGVSYLNGLPAVLSTPANSTLSVSGSGCLFGAGAASTTAWRITTTSANPPALTQP
jgi:hypothetical protein